jgi:HK97 family phage portal protein
MQNAIVYRSVRMIAEAAASVPLILYDGAHEIEDHPLLRLIAAPTPTTTRADLLEAFFGHLLVSGNAYLEATALGGDLRELHILRPDRIQIVPGSDGYAEAYDYTVEGLSPVRLDGDAVPGVRRVLHQKLFHPLNDHYGFSPIEAAATAIDIHNAASRWNKALLDNSARPSGALVYTSRDGNLTTEQYDRLKSELESGFQGAGNAGRPLLLEGGLDWKSMSMSPKDLDFMEAKHGAAREIALALGVPPMLLGIPGDNTFSNYQEANRTFWRQTVLPLVQRTTDALSEWLASSYSGALVLKTNLDNLDALSSERDAQWARLEKSSFLTDDEKRAAIGYGPKQPTNPADQKFNPNHDALGRFTTGDGDSGGNKDPNFIPAAAPPRPPKGPPPPTSPPKAPAAPPKASSGRNQSTDEILKPGGQDIGTVEGRARPNIRTVSPSDFEATKSKLLDGAVEVPTPADYRGKWYQRADGTTVGVRESPESGTTLEVVKGNSKIDTGYKVHKK